MEEAVGGKNIHYQFQKHMRYLVKYISEIELLQAHQQK